MTAAVRVHVATATAIGSSHVAKGRANEDAVTWCATEDGTTVLAVADGHSDPRCVRADRGARLAVRAAVETAATRDARTDVLMTAIADRWRALVTEDERADPLAGEVGDARMLAYGTTLLVGRIDDAGVTLLQIGDGDIVTAGRSSTRRPIPQDGLEWASSTRSLSASDAAATARVAMLGHGELPAVVLLATDGLDNAYPTRDGLLEAGRELLADVERAGASAVDAMLPGWVRDAAATSGDDATVAVAVLCAGARHRGTGSER